MNKLFYIITMTASATVCADESAYSEGVQSRFLSAATTTGLDVLALQRGVITRTNPYSETIATVRQGSALNEGEQVASATRFEYVQKGVRALLGDETIKKAETPRVALCVSGGGIRAALATLGAMIGAEDIGFLQTILYSATLSGSSWLMNACLSGDDPERSVQDNLLCYREHLRHRLKGLFANQDSFQISQMTDNLLYKFYHRQPITIVDLWGIEVGRMMLPHLGNYWQKSTLSSQSEVVESGRYPFPLYTAVQPMGVGKYEWFEFSPYEVWSEYVQAGVPTWAFGRTFKDGLSTNSVAEQSLAYYLGIFGSAFEIEWGPYLEALKNNMRSYILKSLIWLAMKAGMSDMRLNPANLANYTYGMKNSPIGSKPHITLIDAGLDFNLPAPPLLREERKIDVIIYIDASYAVEGAPALRGIEEYAQRSGINIPDLDCAQAGENRVTVFEGSATSPTFVYIPRVINEAFDPNFDPEDAVVNGFAHTYNFEYTPEQADMVCGHMAANVRDCADQLKGVLERVVARKRSQLAA